MPGEELEEEGAISIHAPREGGDRRHPWPPLFHGISIHAPREGGDFSCINHSKHKPKFQSTPPARGATRFQRKRGCN